MLFFCEKCGRELEENENVILSCDKCERKYCEACGDLGCPKCGEETEVFER